ncbi:hypothetical protein P7C70_g3035, partial [Phenoliferia sp. Uapishka_3]
MLSAVFLSALVSFGTLSSAFPLRIRSAGVAAIAAPISFNSAHYQSGFGTVAVLEDELALSWGGLDARSPLAFAYSAVGLVKRAVLNPKYVPNPKYSGYTAELGVPTTTSTTKTSSPTPSPTTTAVAVAKATLGSTSSGLKLDGIHTGQATYFSVGLGACGTYASDSDYIVAASHLIYDTFPGATANPNNNPICGLKIAATYKGKTITVTVQDECEGCDAWNLDFSPTAFKQFAPESAGRLDGMTWVFI